MASEQTIRTALERAAATIALKPTVGQRVYVSTAVVEDGLACRVREKDHVLVADLPASMGGENSGPSPSVLLRAALSSCVAMGIKMWAARKHVAVDRIEVSVETDVDARGQFGVLESVAPGFEGVRVKVFVESAAAPSIVREVIQTSLRFSPLVDAFRQSHVVETEVAIKRCVAGDQ
jgi:uncharacterized OsmC-like protein